MTNDADRKTLALKRELIARGEYHGADTPRAPCADCLRRHLATARAALVSALGYARLLDRAELAEQIARALAGVPKEIQP